jgi:hypothetical protein
VKKDAEIDYDGSKYRLVYIEIAVGRSQRLQYAASAVWQLMDGFSVDRSLVLAPAVAAIISPSLRRTLYSAIVCALEACRCVLPAFLLSAPLDAAHRARETLGYALLPPLTAGSTSYEPSGTVQYESALLEGVAPKHDLYYVDGLSQLFASKLTEYSGGRLVLNKSSCFANVVETYIYRISENDRFLTRSVNYNTGTRKLRPHPEIMSTIEDLVAAFPDRDDSSAALNQLALKINYGVLKLASVVDNEYYTTLHPSSLPHDYWTVEADFLPLHNSADLEPQGLAYCLRQLLAFYIAGKCCPGAQTAIGMSGKNGKFFPIERSKAVSAAGVLSMRSRDAVSAVCATLPAEFLDEYGNYAAAAGSGVCIPQDLLMRVFSRSLWVEAGSDGHEGDEAFQMAGPTSPWTWMASQKAAPVVSSD